VLSIALLIIQLNTRFLLLSQRSYLPGVTFLLISLCFFNVKLFHPALIAAILILFATENLIDTYRQDNLTYKIFDASLLIGIAALIYPPTLFLILFLYIALLILRPFFWREWAFVILGVALPFYLTYSFMYIFHGVEFKSLFLDYFNFLHIDCFNADIHPVKSIALYYLLFLVLLGSAQIIQSLGIIKIIVRKSYYIFFALFINLLLIYFFVPCAGKEMLVLLAVPLSYLLSFYFQSARNKRIKNIFFDLLVILLLMARYF
jgi:hypothetical protein